jgi:hypothetical protein
MHALSSGLIGLAGCTKGRQRGRTTAAERVDYGDQITDAVALSASVEAGPDYGRKVQDATAAASRWQVAQRGSRGSRAPV